MAPSTGPPVPSCWRNAGPWEAAPPEKPGSPDGYDLPAGRVMHTVGPVWKGGSHGEDALLAGCYRSCFAIAEEHGFRTIAFPAVSAGAYGFPMDRAAATAVTETAKFLARNKSVDTVMLVCFSDRAYQCYLDAVRDIVG